jgi:hypothetical protein
MLFDDCERIEGDPSEPGESPYTFLNSAAGESWQRVRDLLTEWLSHYPAEDRPTLITRFRRSDRRGFLGAFWELYLHELFRRLGFDIVLHRTVDRANHRPDFRLHLGNTVTYVEAVTIYESQARPIDDARLAPVLDAVNDVSPPDFHLDVEAYAIGDLAPAVSQLSRKLESWVQALDGASAASSSRSDSNHMLRWRHQGWDLRFSASPRSSKDRGTAGSRAKAANPGRGGIINDHRVFRQRLGEKTRFYGRQLDAPFVIALISYRPTTDFAELLTGLFGSAWEHPEMIRDRAIHRSRLAGTNGFWLTNKGVQYRDTSAVLTAFELMPWSVARSRPWLIANPWASHPLEIALPFNRVAVDPGTGTVERVETDFQPAAHFGLPPNWP